MRVGWVVAVLAALSLSVGRASAEFWLEQNGSLQETGSWTVPFLLTLPDVDRIAARVTVGDVFEDPGFDAFDQAGWSLTAASSDGLVALSEGPSTASPLSFSLHFLGNPPTVDDQVVIDVAAYSAGSWFMAHGTWVAAPGGFFGTGRFLMSAGTWDPTADLAAIPAPGAALLGVIGLVALAFSRRSG